MVLVSSCSRCAIVRSLLCIDSVATARRANGFRQSVRLKIGQPDWGPTEGCRPRRRLPWSAHERSSIRLDRSGHWPLRGQAIPCRREEQSGRRECGQAPRRGRRISARRSGDHALPQSRKRSASAEAGGGGAGCMNERAVLAPERFRHDGDPPDSATTWRRQISPATHQ